MKNSFSSPAFCASSVCVLPEGVCPRGAFAPKESTGAIASLPCMSVSDTRCSESSGRTETSGAGGFPSSLLLCRTAAMVCASSSCSLTAGAAKSGPMICVMSMKSPRAEHAHERLGALVPQRRGGDALLVARVERAAHGLVAAEGEGEVGDAAGNLAPGAEALDLARGVDEINSVVVVLLHAGADGQDVGIEDDVLGVEADLLHEELEGAAADAHLLRLSRRLTLSSNAITTTAAPWRLTMVACLRNSSYS